MRHATAYENYGRFVVDCPNPQDTTAWEIPQGQRRWECWRPADPALNRPAVGCGEEFLIDWPGDHPDSQQQIVTATTATPTQAELRAEADREHLAQHTAADGETVTPEGGHTEETTAIEADDDTH